jgi:hypothetical protein
MPQYVECGSCGGFHRSDYWGDCRNDAERFTAEDLDTKHGPNNWDYLSIEDQMRAESDPD